MVNKTKHALNKNSRGGVLITRKLGEAIIIGDNIRVTFTARRNNEIRLLVQAPRDIKIIRENREDTEILKMTDHNEKNKQLAKLFYKGMSNNEDLRD